MGELSKLPNIGKVVEEQLKPSRNYDCRSVDRFGQQKRLAAH